jgi:hypothetical protein
LKIVWTIKVVVFLTLSLVSVIGGIRLFVTPGEATQLPYPSYPFVSVYPDNETRSVNETFTISVIVYNLTNKQVPDPNAPTTMIPLGNLYGFDIQFTWDPTIIHCLNHTVTVPFESYSTPISPSPYAGVLHGYGPPTNTSLVKVEDVVNESGIVGAAAPDVRAWFAYATMTPASVFNGNGTIATMTFKVLKEGQSALQIVSAMLADVVGLPIGFSQRTNAWLNPPRSGIVRSVGAPFIKSVAYWPSVDVVNKPLHFNASVTGNDTDVATYMWDFGDGTGVENATTPTIDHTYTSPNVYTVTLRVVDADGAESGSFSVPEVKVAASRDLEATSVTLSQSSILPNRTLTVTARVSNLGSADFTFYENCTVRLYYNASSLGSHTAWVQVGTGQNASIPNGVSGFKNVGFQLNSSSLPKLEAYYYFEFNVTGIPGGYEANTTNNVKVSNALLYTNTIAHKVSIDNFAFGYKSTSASTPKLPVIRGENTSVSISVRNAGNEYDQFNVTLYVNNSVTKSWTTSALGADKSQTFSWSYAFDAGHYNLTAVASGANVSSVESGILTVIKTPSLAIDYSPQSPAVGQEVTINGSKSIHQDPNGTITSYLWKIFAPGVATSGTPNATFSGSNLTVISFAFNTSGKWTVLLTVTDNYQLTYDSKRGATSAYQKAVIVSVASSAAALPIELVIAVVVAAVIVIAVAVILLRRRRRPKPRA